MMTNMIRVVKMKKINSLGRAAAMSNNEDEDSLAGNAKYK